MRLRCPACGAQASLEILIEDQAAAEAVRQALELSPLGPRLVRYLALFRPVKSRLTWPRVNSLLAALLPLIKSGELTRHGRTVQATEREWAAALDAVLAARDAGKLRLPLKSHGYLCEVVLSKCAGPWPSEPVPAHPAGAKPVGAGNESGPASQQAASATARAIARLQARKRPSEGTP